MWSGSGCSSSSTGSERASTESTATSGDLRSPDGRKEKLKLRAPPARSGSDAVRLDETERPEHDEQAQKADRYPDANRQRSDGAIRPAFVLDQEEQSGSQAGEHTDENCRNDDLCEHRNRARRRVFEHCSLASLRLGPTMHARLTFPARACRAPSARRTLVPSRCRPLSKTWLEREDRPGSGRRERAGPSTGGPAGDAGR